MQLFGYWRSLATFRVRVALNLKGLEPESLYVDLDSEEHRSDLYRNVNPQMMVPALLDGDGPALFQSLAILEYIEERHPRPPLLPATPRGRARVRALAQIVACDAQPFLVPRVRDYVGAFSNGHAGRLAWVRHWIDEGLGALENHLSRDRETGLYCHGDKPTIADISVASLAVGNQLFGGELTRFPKVAEIVMRCMRHREFRQAHPLLQPGAPLRSRPNSTLARLHENGIEAGLA